MAAINDGVRVRPPAARPPKHSLLLVGEDLLGWDGDPSNISAPTDIDSMWEAGIKFNPEDCSLDSGMLAPCFTTDMDAENNCLDFIDYTPLVAWISITDSTWNIDSKDFKGRVKRALAAQVSHILATELWTGAVAQANSLQNIYLANEGAVTIINSGDPMALVQGFAELQERLALCMFGGVGMIHVPPRVLTLLQSAHLIHTEIDRDTGIIHYMDKRGNVVISDSGYNGSAPDGSVDATHSTAWIYATGPVGVATGEPKVDPEKDSQAVNRGSNDITFYAYQFVAATWDGCCLIGANLSTCDTCCTGDLLAEGG